MSDKYRVKMIVSTDAIEAESFEHAKTKAEAMANHGGLNVLQVWSTSKVLDMDDIDIL